MTVEEIGKMRIYTGSPILAKGKVRKQGTGLPSVVKMGLHGNRGGRQDVGGEMDRKPGWVTMKKRAVAERRRSRKRKAWG